MRSQGQVVRASLACGEWHKRFLVHTYVKGRKSAHSAFFLSKLNYHNLNFLRPICWPSFYAPAPTCHGLDNDDRDSLMEAEEYKGTATGWQQLFRSTTELTRRPILPYVQAL